MNMLSLFKNKKLLFQSNDRTEVAKVIAVKCIIWQQRWAACMQHHSQRLSHTWKVVILTIFCLCAGGCSLFLIAKSLRGNHTLSLGLSQINNSLLKKSGNEKVRIDELITDEQHDKIESFRRYMDSLARSPSGKVLYNNILMCRPGLMDSIVLFENIYQLQTKK